MTTTVLGSAVGSFVFEPPPISDPNLARLKVSRGSGAHGGRFAGRSGVAFRMPVAQLSAADIQNIQARLERRVQVAQSGIAPVLEAGRRGMTAFVIEAPLPGELLRDRIERRGRLSPFETVALVRSLATMLETANLRHGQLSSSLIWVTESNAPALSGFSFQEPAADADAIGLAALAFEMLSGRRFEPQSFEHLPEARNERIREALPDLTAHLAAVVAGGTRGVFGAPSALAAALESAREESIVMLADAAHQSIGRKDPAGANVFLELARGYDSSHPEIKAVEARLAGGAVSSPIQSINPIAMLLLKAEPDHGYEPGSEQAKFLESLRAAVPDATPRKKRLPWIAIAAGMFGVFALLTVIAVIVAQSS